MSDTSQGPGWWIASDGKWYPPEAATPAPATPAAEPAPGSSATDATPAAPAAEPGGPPAPGWWLASDGNWYPPADPGATAGATAPEGATPPAASSPPTPTGGPGSPATGPGAPTRSLPVLPILIGVGVVFLLIVAAVGFVTLRGRGSELTPNQIASGPDEVPSSDLTLADDTVVVRGGGGAAVKELSTDGRTIVLDAGAEGADALESGDVMVLTGITAGKVTSVDRSGDDVRVGLEPAAITDVISDGELSWPDQAVDFSTASLRVWEPSSEPANKVVGLSGVDAILPRGADGPGAGDAGGAGGADGPGEASGFRAPAVGTPVLGAAAMVDADPVELAQPAERSGQVGGYTYRFTPRVTSSRLAFDLTVGTDADGYAILIEATVDVSDLTTNGSLAVSGGNVTNFGFNASSVNGSATVDATASTGPQFGRGSVTAFTIPMSIDVPIVIAGIPFTLALGAEMSIEPAFSAADASVTGKLELTYDGNAGMSVSGASLTGTGAFNPETTSPEEVIGGLSISPVAVIVHMEFPQISFGLGTALARASATFNVRNSVGVQFSGSSHVIPCAAQNQAMVMTAGITGEFLGSEVELASIELYRKTWDFFVPDAQACQF